MPKSKRLYKKAKNIHVSGFMKTVLKNLAPITHISP